MLVITLGYTSYAIPDEYASHLFTTLAVMKPLKSVGYGSDKNYTYSDDELRIDCVKILDSIIELSESQKEKKEVGYLDKEPCEPEIAEKKKEIVISETYDSPF